MGITANNSEENKYNDRKGYIANIDPDSWTPRHYQDYIWGISDFQRIIAGIIIHRDEKKYNVVKHTERYVSLFSTPSGMDEKKMRSTALANKIFSVDNRKQHEPWLINAPTGAGKSTFVLTELAQVAEESGGKFLFLAIGWRYTSKRNANYAK